MISNFDMNFTQFLSFAFVQLHPLIGCHTHTNRKSAHTHSVCESYILSIFILCMVHSYSFYRLFSISYLDFYLWKLSLWLCYRLSLPTYLYIQLKILYIRLDRTRDSSDCHTYLRDTKTKLMKRNDGIQLKSKKKAASDNPRECVDSSSNNCQFLSRFACIL